MISDRGRIKYSGEEEDNHFTQNVILRRVRITNVAVENQYVLHILSVCFVALVIQHAKRMRCIILSSVARLALAYVFILHHKRQDFLKEEHKILNTRY
jgi:hypothetical protein